LAGKRYNMGAMASAPFRSQAMDLVQLYIQSEAAHHTVEELGQLGLVQFRDLNKDQSAYQRNFVNDVRRCEELERKIRYFLRELQKEKINPKPCEDDKSVVLDAEFDTHLEELEKDLQSLTENEEKIRRERNEYVELKQILSKDHLFFEDTHHHSGGTAQVGSEVEFGEITSGDDSYQGSGALGMIAGVIPTSKINGFERILFRATRGNIFLRSSEIPQAIVDPKTGEEVEKSVFAIFFSGDRSFQKIAKICDSFGANRYKAPESPDESSRMSEQVHSKLDEITDVLDNTEEHKLDVLEKIGESILTWKSRVKKEKAIYHTMNMFNYNATTKCLIAEAWCPTSSLDAVQDAMKNASAAAGAEVASVLSVVPTHDKRPTYFATNKFTLAFQEIVDAYGIPRYGEYNPAVFTVMTFPFLFGVMFGDVGHGLLMTAFALFMVLKEDKIRDMFLNSDLLQMAYKGRYVILLMGVSATYCGAVYNEVFAIPLNLFQSKWHVGCPEFRCPEPRDQNNTKFYDYYESDLPFDNTSAKWPRDWVAVPAYTFPFGIDAGWVGTGNKLNYYNSLKMKLSIVLGVTQMVVGTFCKLANTIHFRNALDLFVEVIPEFLFMNCLFGYLVILIFVKWTTNWESSFFFYHMTNGTKYTFMTPEECTADAARLGDCLAQQRSPPDLLDTLIKMAMSPGQVAVEDTIYPGQAMVQTILILIAVVCVPILLLPKPLILLAKNKKKAGYVDVDDPDAAVPEEKEHEEEFQFGEVMVHQMIHTIEYVLGAISNTASYLRLWALSLAHAQLSEVFYERVLETMISMGICPEGGDSECVTQPYLFVTIFLGIGAWAGATLAVLMVMETLSAVLHALRLHWVEFQNKFYHGDGYKFEPFNFLFNDKEE